MNETRGAVLMALVAALVAACGPEPTPSGPLMPSVTPTATITAPQPSPSTVPTGVSAWSAVGPDLGGCSVTTAVVRHFGELLAVCQDFANLTVQVLTSTDGRSWTHNEPTGLQPLVAGHVVLLNGLADSNDGMLVLVGAEASEDISSGDAAAWTSADGLHWNRANSIAAFGDADLLAVTATRSGFVAVGDDGFPGGNVQEPTLRGGAVWHSADGRIWERLPGLASFAHRQLQGIVVTPSRDLIWGAAAFDDAGIWTSDDGRSWVLASEPTGGTWGQIGQVLPTDYGYVAVGAAASSGSGVGTVGEIWTSADGRAWVPVPIGGTGSTIGFWGIAEAEANLVAMANGGAVAASTDGGSTWMWLPADPGLSGMTQSRLESVNGSVVAFGNVTSGGTGEGRIWIAEPTLDVPGYGPDPGLSVLDPQVVITPATGLHDGETVTVSVTGFGAGGKVWLSECALAADATSLGCGDQLAAQTFLVTGDDRAGSTSFVVHVTASGRPLGGAEQTCRAQCVLVATIGDSYAFQIAPLVFAP